MFIIDDLLFWLPAKSLVFILKRVRDMVENELSEEQKTKLLGVDAEWEEGYLDDENYFNKGMDIINERKNE